MEWLYFDLIKVNAGYYLFDVKYEAAIQEAGKVKVFVDRAEAEDYLVEQDIRGSVRNVVEAGDEAE